MLLRTAQTLNESWVVDSKAIAYRHHAWLPGPLRQRTAICDFDRAELGRCSAHGGYD